MSDPVVPPQARYRAQIVDSLTPVRPLAPASRRAWTLVPIGVLLAITAPLLIGQRGDLRAYAPIVTWGLTGLQTLVGVWFLALGFREAVPGRNVSTRALTLAFALTAAIVIGITLATSAASATVVPGGLAFQYWLECVVWPMAVGAPFMIVATLMAVRAFPTRPAITGALCGMSAGVLSDAGWRLSCWISEPAHIFSAHGLAILGLAGLGALVAIAADVPRWRRLRSRS